MRGDDVHNEHSAIRQEVVAGLHRLARCHLVRDGVGGLERVENDGVVGRVRPGCALVAQRAVQEDAAVLGEDAHAGIVHQKKVLPRYVYQRGINLDDIGGRVRPLDELVARVRERAAADERGAPQRSSYRLLEAQGQVVVVKVLEPERLSVVRVHRRLNRLEVAGDGDDGALGTGLELVLDEVAVVVRVERVDGRRTRYHRQDDEHRGADPRAGDLRVQRALDEDGRETEGHQGEPRDEVVATDQRDDPEAADERSRDSTERTQREQ